MERKEENARRQENQQRKDTNLTRADGTRKVKDTQSQGGEPKEHRTTQRTRQPQKTAPKKRKRRKKHTKYTSWKLIEEGRKR